MRPSLGVPIPLFPSNKLLCSPSLLNQNYNFQLSFALLILCLFPFSWNFSPLFSCSNALFTKPLGGPCCSEYLNPRILTVFNISEFSLFQSKNLTKTSVMIFWQRLRYSNWWQTQMLCTMDISNKVDLPGVKSPMHCGKELSTSWENLF